jgi:hypothetical protein
MILPKDSQYVPYNLFCKGKNVGHQPLANILNKFNAIFLVNQLGVLYLKIHQPD